MMVQIVEMYLISDGVGIEPHSTRRLLTTFLL